jgi:hypothetical protein
MGMFYAIASPTILDSDMTQLIKNIADKTHFTVADSPIWRAKVQEYSQAIVVSCIEQISDLRGYSGVGTNGDPYDTPSWNAALAAAEQLLRERFEIEPKSR